MTVRLVGLMSVVLLLSLASFGLLMSHSQDQVMDEVMRTVSSVGKATLRTFEFETETNAFVADGESAAETNGFVWMTTGEFPPAGHTVHHEKIDGEIVVRKAFRCGSDPTAERECDLDEIEDLLGPRGVDAMQQIGHLTPGEAAGEQRVILIESVHVGPDPAAGQPVLKIPLFMTREEAATSPVREQREHSGEEIRLPIPVAEYDQLFASIRGRSLLLFLGVFVVGMVLSTGLATRFTKPIRKLDAGIQRLAEGDADVQVQVQGQGEIARLSSNFNEMARKLRENRDRAREMVRQEKLSALGGLAAGVAHDVRNPLHSIGLTLQHLREACRPEATERAEEFDRSVEIIRGEIRRLDGLVTNFLRFARAERGERQPVDLADMLRETARLITKEAEWRGVQVELDLNAAIPAVSAHAESVRSSILNLVLNSFEAMPEGGTLTLALRIEGETVVVEVADTGRGIPPEEHEKVFEFAYTTREGGSGLGLATVHHAIVDEHGGRVSLDSQPGQGTRVRLALPLRPPQRETSA